ncbi:MAG: plastocyanin/azurin family copper-binding protein [Ktedonobacteraceae bacterium]
MNTNLLSFARSTRWFWKVISLTAVAAFLLAACGGSPAATPTPTATTAPTPTATTAPTSAPAATVMVKIVEKNEKYSFEPASLNVKVGTQVVWLNTTDAPHTVTSDTGGTFASPNNITQNQNFKFAFATAGTFPYHCNIHPYMKATITVTS